MDVYHHQRNRHVHGARPDPLVSFRVADQHLVWTAEDALILWRVELRANRMNLDCREWDRGDAHRMLQWQDDPHGIAYLATEDLIINIRGGGGVLERDGIFA